jgi:hypothetical protein
VHSSPSSLPAQWVPTIAFSQLGLPLTGDDDEDDDDDVLTSPAGHSGFSGRQTAVHISVALATLFAEMETGWQQPQQF